MTMAFNAILMAMLLPAQPTTTKTRILEISISAAEILISTAPQLLQKELKAKEISIYLTMLILALQQLEMDLGMKMTWKPMPLAELALTEILILVVVIYLLPLLVPVEKVLNVMAS